MSTCSDVNPIQVTFTTDREPGGIKQEPKIIVIEIKIEIYNGCGIGTKSIISIIKEISIDSYVLLIKLKYTSYMYLQI